MNCIVTGGAGFIGSHLVEKLLKLNHKVIVIDNLSTGRKSNLDFCFDNKNFKFIEEDLCEKHFSLVIEDDIDWVFHLAALADIVPSIEEPIKYFNANVIGTINLTEFVRLKGVKKYIYAASSSCYGIPNVFPTPELQKTDPKYPYALTKFLGEQIIMHYSEIYNIPSISLRLFNVYGPRARTTGTYGAVFGVFLAQKLANKPFTVVGDGNQTRDFTFVSDVCSAFIAAATSNINSGIFNVGSGMPHSINYLVNLLNGPVTMIPKRPGEPDCTFADISKIEKDLGWKPQISFEKGVKIMLDHINDWKDAPVWNEDGINRATKKWFQYLGDSGF